MNSVVPLLVVLAIILVAAKLVGSLSVRLGQPAVLGELMAGLLLGPSVIDLLAIDALHAEHAGEVVHLLGELGVIFLMFAAGLEVELSDMRRAGRPASLAGILGVVGPVVLGSLTALAFGYPALKSIFVGLVLSATSVSISAQTLMELGLIRNRVGLALLGAAVIDDVLVILGLSLFVALASGDQNVAGVTLVLLRMFLFLGVSFFAGLWLLPRIMQFAERLPVNQGVLAVVLATALLFGWASEELGGVAAITGAFIAGMGFGRSHLREEIGHALNPMLYGLFVPIFLVGIGLQANIRAVSREDIWFTAAITLVAILSKVIGAGIGARLGGFDNRDSFRLGLGMISRGEVGLIVAGVGVAQAILAPSVFTIVVVMVLATTLVTPPLLRWGFRSEEERHA